jgi:hypothetical protein
MQADRVAGCRGDGGHTVGSTTAAASAFASLVGVLLPVSGPVLASHWGRIYHGGGQAIVIPLPELRRALSSRQSRTRTRNSWSRNNVPLLRGTAHRPRGEFGRQVFSAAERATCQKWGKWGTRQPKAAEPKTAAAVIEGDAACQAIGQPIGQGPRISRSPSLVLLWSVRPSRQQSLDSERLLTPIFSLALMNAGWWPRMSEN